ncbi:Uncharacterised protein [Chlamydia trachomatis]|nr:Uncharacterised protein [Chlamydia trachomatis]
MRVSIVRHLPTSRVRSSSAFKTWLLNLLATCLLTFAVTFGFPSLSDPIQLPGWKNAGHRGGTNPAFLPKSQSSNLR